MNKRLRLGVNVGGGLVEDKNGRVLDDRAGQGNALPLPAREHHAPLTHGRLVALRQLRDELVGVCLLRCSLDFRLGGIELAVADVLADGGAEEEGLLDDHGQRPAHALEREVADILSVERDPALLRVEEARDQVGNRRLARPGVPYERDSLAGLRCDSDVLEHGHAGVVGEAHVLERHRTLHAVQGVGVRLL